MMRTTVNLPDDIYAVVRSLAEAKRISLGQALGDLARKALQPAGQIDDQAAFPHFRVRKDAAPITLEQTLKAVDQL